MRRVTIAVPNYSKEGKSSLGSKGPYLGDLVFKEIKKIINQKSLKDIEFEKIPIKVENFPDTAGKTISTKPLRGSKLYIIHPYNTCHDTHCATAKRIATEANYSDVKEVNLVEPYNSAWRQEKRQGRESLDARRIAEEYKNSGINRVFAFDVHCPQVSLGFSPMCPLEGMDLSGPIINFIEKNKIVGKKNTIMAFPDRGAFKNYNHMAQAMDLNSIVLDKNRVSSDDAEMKVLLPMGKKINLEGSTVIIRDDESSTGGTLVRAVKTLKNDFGVKKVFACITHLKLSMLDRKRRKKAIDNIVENDIHVITTNTVPLPKNLSTKVEKRISVMPIQKLIAELIAKRESGKTLSKFFSFEKWQE